MFRLVNNFNRNLMRGIFSSRCVQSTYPACSYCNENTEKTEGEKRLLQILEEKFPGATMVDVCDISGGCGSMYDVQIVAGEFMGKRTVLQHRMVTDALKGEIENMHGLRIRTDVPETKS